jgi:hypothetical protein
MEMTPDDLDGIDPDLARRVIAAARSIAPGITSLTGEDRLSAIAILKAVAKIGMGRADLGVANQRTADSSVGYRDVGTWFSDMDRDGLRVLVADASASTRGPIGSFPQPSRIMRRLFPEPPYTS